MTKHEIQLLRHRLGLTQAELAQRIGVQSTSVSRWERGQAMPSKLAQRALAKLDRGDK